MADAKRPHPAAPILVVDDDTEMCALLVEILKDNGYATHTATSGREALWMMNSIPFQLVVTDLRMKGMSGMVLLRDVRAQYPDTEVIMITAFGSIDTAIEAIKAGAYDYITKPFKIEQILAVVRRALEKTALKAELKRLKATGAGLFHGMVGVSQAMQGVFTYVRRVAASPASILITGESGTGKELVARAIHAESQRTGPFVPINCAAIPESLMEGELFGVRKGAYTDAREDRAGLFEQAAGGTLFLDEVGEIPLPLQSKLLRVLQERVIRRVGDTRQIPLDVRIVSATNSDLKRAIAEGRFREDLYYRLNVIPIHLPPLRERPEDLVLLAETMVERFAQENGKHVAGIAEGAMRRLAGHAWPGNVRELANTLERAVILTQGEYVTPDDLPEELAEAGNAQRMLPGDAAGGVTLEELERSYILRIMEETGGNRTEAAQRLGIDRKTLYRKLQRYGFPDI